jgi:glycosyltransferase involved in cell wall biosynthesis
MSLRSRLHGTADGFRRYALRGAALAFIQARLFARQGPAGNLRYLRHTLSPKTQVHRFANGLANTLDPRETRKWHMLHPQPLVIALYGTPGDVDLAAWVSKTTKEMRGHALVSPEIAAALEGVDPLRYTVRDFIGSSTETDFFAIKGWMHQHWRMSDLVFFNVGDPIPEPFDIMRTQHAAHAYQLHHNDIGIVAPQLNVGDHQLAGYEWDRASSEWWVRDVPTTDHGQGLIPRYVLAANAHGLYITKETFDQVPLTSAETAELDFEQQLNRFIAKAWQQNVRTLAYPLVQYAVTEARTPTATDFDREWLTGRNVNNSEGKKRIIFVLPATSVSGGIRTVFEQADSFQERGFDTEIWALQEQPTWVDLGVQVRTFSNYFDMVVALRNEEAIKVATWWETAQVVWLASVNTGIPVYYVQEFETWFYPDNPSAQAAVVSSYRREMHHVTIADYQRGELRDVGVAATLVPSGFDENNFHVIPGAERRSDTVLALGRSFFQKNFAMTLAAWSSLGESRPLLSLYGTEPDVAEDERIRYALKPRNSEVNVLFNEATCFIQTSRHEGFGLPIIEAMATGCPVITTDSHGNRDFCFDEVNCLIVEQDDVEGLARAIERVMGDPALQESLRIAGLKTAKDYRWSVVMDQLEQFYDSAR